LRLLKPQSFGLEKLIYGKEFFRQEELQQLRLVAVTGCRDFTQSFAKFCPIFLPFLICKVFKPNIFEFSKQPNKNSFLSFVSV
jgi:hypothetical protein